MRDAIAILAMLFIMAGHNVYSSVVMDIAYYNRLQTEHNARIAAMEASADTLRKTLYIERTTIANLRNQLDEGTGGGFACPVYKEKVCEPPSVQVRTIVKTKTVSAQCPQIELPWLCQLFTDAK